MKKIFYLGYYDTLDNKEENRNHVLSSSNKMTYICSVLKRSGRIVEFVSAAGTKNKKSCRGKYKKIDDNLNLKLFYSLGRGNKIKNIIDRLGIKCQLFFYLLNHVKQDDKIIVYHSLGYSRIIRFLKKMIGFKLILEVEEIYSDVSGIERFRKMEQRIFDVADAYIFSTELLDEKLNKNNKPSVVIYGTYQVEEDRRCSFDDENFKDKIHLLYAGTFDPRKGGAIAAAAAAAELPSKYHVHILGFGSNENTSDLIKKIQEISFKSEAKVTYDGLLSGEKYIQFVQNCHIGLSTQNPDAKFNETSFPSKVLSYLANGLRVVSVRIKALEKSSIGDLLYYYDEQTPEAIANTVKSIDFSQPYDSRKRIIELDKNFTNNIDKMLNNL